jgi:hypothetical protein
MLWVVTFLRRETDLLPNLGTLAKPSDLDLREAFETHKREHYQKLLAILKKGTVEIYLIPRVTSTGKPRKKYAGNGKQDGKIGTLEELLIGSALVMNPDLANLKSKKQIQLAGYMNDESEERSAAAKRLAKLLGRPTKK